PRSQVKLSKLKIAVLSVAASCGVLVVSLILQWLVYDDWLRQTGPLHLVGTSIAAALLCCDGYWSCATGNER
ncbi:MAG TPA: hypothetical protein VG498_23965, partial [Terriglobales bacterium]|nr:hypothetical protein [Terriglobales bacterium]